MVDHGQGLEASNPAPSTISVQTDDLERVLSHSSTKNLKAAVTTVLQEAGLKSRHLHRRLEPCAATIQCYYLPVDIAE